MVTTTTTSLGLGLVYETKVPNIQVLFTSPIMPPDSVLVSFRNICLVWGADTIGALKGVTPISGKSVGIAGSHH